MASPAPVDLGYALATDPPTGHRLDVWIRERPTERHFDPERAQFVIAAAGNGLDMLEVQHPAQTQEYRVCAGRVLLTDRKSKVVEIFTYGGKLVVDPQAALTLCCLTSTAPLLLIDDDVTSPLELLIEETEVLLAERRAARLANPDEYERRLSAVDALELYAACLHTLEGQIARRHPAPDQPESRLLHHVRTEAHRLAEAGVWPAVPSTIAEVL